MCEHTSQGALGPLTKNSLHRRPRGRAPGALVGPPGPAPAAVLKRQRHRDTPGKPACGRGACHPEKKPEWKPAAGGWTHRAEEAGLPPRAPPRSGTDRHQLDSRMRVHRRRYVGCRMRTGVLDRWATRRALLFILSRELSTDAAVFTQREISFYLFLPP